ncbi:regulator of G-protein signaling rgs-7, partial [Aphelenchoides avenae]
PALEPPPPRAFCLQGPTLHRHRQSPWVLRKTTILPRFGFGCRHRIILRTRSAGQPRRRDAFAEPCPFRKLVVAPRSPEKNAEKVGGGARNFFANIKDKIISVSGRLPKADAGHWSESFTAFLEDKRACEYFREYLKTEFSEDNLDFAVACRQFRNITDKKKANRKAKFIFTTFLKDGAAKWVNLDYKTKAAVKEAYDAGVSPDMFRLAQDHIEDLMKNDSYKRFLESPLYAELERVSPPPTTHSTPLPGNTALARRLQLGSQDSPTQMAMSSAGNAAVTRRLQLRSQDGPVQMPVMNDAYNERTLRPRLQTNSFCNLRTPSGCN